LRAEGDVVLDTIVLQIDEQHKPSLYDPRRVPVGALTAALTWAVFGLLTGGLTSMIASAILGAAWGAWAAYRYAHHATQAQLTRAGEQLPASSSALLTFAETTATRRLLAAAHAQNAAAASVAAIAPDLTGHVTAVLPAKQSVADGPATPDRGGAAPEIHMIVARYPDLTSAAEVATELPRLGEDTQVELVVVTDRSGRRTVADPKLGASAVARYNLRSWGVLGLVCGALAGITGGSLLGVLEGGILTAIVWGLFGLGAGALYGLWVGRSVSARRLRGLAPLLAPGTSVLLAWSDGAPNQAVRDRLTRQRDARLLTLTFRAVESGALLAAE
jgi:hypothetical protein